MKKIITLAIAALLASASVASAQVYYGTTQIAHGTNSSVNITAATAVKASPGVVATICVIVAGSSGNNQINDAATTGAAASSNLVYSQPFGSGTVGQCINLEMPMNTGIVVTPSTGATLAVFYR